MAHVFISYAKKDTRELALRLHEMLNAMPGFTAWMDETLVPGKSWARSIEREIDRADFVVVLLSPDVNRPEEDDQPRSFVLNEIDYAQQIGKTIIPLMAQRTRQPIQIAGLQYIDLTTNEAAGLQRLMKRLVSSVPPFPHLAPMVLLAPMIVLSVLIVVSMPMIVSMPIAVSVPPTPSPTLDTTVAALQATLDYWGTVAPTVIATLENKSFIGNANVYPFYDDTVNFQDITIVELQLILYEPAITPTPFGQATLVPANQNVDRPRVEKAPNSQLTPRPARVEETRNY